MPYVNLINPRRPGHKIKRDAAEVLAEQQSAKATKAQPAVTEKKLPSGPDTSS